ncbi:MAG: 6-phosphogluconolactonase [Actinomycetota bacterium]
MTDLRVAPDAGAAAREAAAWLAAQVRNAARRRGMALVALSGGATPIAMLSALAGLDVPWADFHVWQVDERVAPDDDPARNSAMLELLPLRRENVHLMPVTAVGLLSAAWQYAVTLPQRFDVVHLGLGEDGHTASWPPGDGVVDSPYRVALCAEYRGHVRMTITPRVVNGARRRLLLVTGPAKAEPIRRWFLDDPKLPVHRVRRSDTVVIMDAAAAAALPPRLASVANDGHLDHT